MAVMDEFKEERKAVLKDGSFKQKLAYFWDYYKWHTIGTIAAVAMVISLVYNITHQRDEALYVAVLNSANLLQDNSFTDQFMEYAGINPDTESVTLDTSMDISFTEMTDIIVGSMEKMMAYLAAAQLDIIIAGDELYEHYANEETFLDLRNVLTEEQLERYQSDLYYVDRALVVQIMEASNRMELDFSPEIPDPTKPELMEDPIPVGVYIDDSEKFFSSYYVSNGDRAVLGFVINAQHLDNAVTFLEYLLSGD